MRAILPAFMYCLSYHDTTVYRRLKRVSALMYHGFRDTLLSAAWSSMTLITGNIRTSSRQNPSSSERCCRDKRRSLDIGCRHQCPVCEISEYDSKGSLTTHRRWYEKWQESRSRLLRTKSPKLSSCASYVGHNHALARGLMRVSLKLATPSERHGNVSSSNVLERTPFAHSTAPVRW